MDMAQQLPIALKATKSVLDMQPRKTSNNSSENNDTLGPLDSFMRHQSQDNLDLRGSQATFRPNLASQGELFVRLVL